MATPPEKIKEEPKAEAPKEAPAKSLLVTSSKTVDFPSFDWGINAGETRELPTDKNAQVEILSKSYITPLNK